MPGGPGALGGEELDEGPEEAEGEEDHLGDVDLRDGEGAFVVAVEGALDGAIVAFGVVVPKGQHRSGDEHGVVDQHQEDPQIAPAGMLAEVESQCGQRSEMRHAGEPGQVEDDPEVSGSNGAVIGETDDQDRKTGHELLVAEAEGEVHEDIVPFLAAPGAVQEEEACESFEGELPGLEEVGEVDEHARGGEEDGNEGGEAEGPDDLWVGLEAASCLSALHVSTYSNAGDIGIGIRGGAIVRVSRAIGRDGTTHGWRERHEGGT